MSLLAQLSEELERLVAQAAPSVVGVEHGRGQGTGLVLTGDGYIITNAHVVRGAGGEVRVRVPAGESVRADRIGLDGPTDLAVLRVAGEEMSSLPLADSRRLKVGQLVVAIGNPFRFERSVSLGIVSARDRSLPGPDGVLFEGLIQTDAAINPGNSGGPLLDARGAVVGINTAVVAYAQGIGFAVPAHTAGWVAAELIHRGEIRRRFIGITAGGVDLPPAVALEAGQPRAVRVHGVGPDSPADAAGLRDADLLLRAEGCALLGVDDLQRVMALCPSPEVRLEVLRGRRRQELPVRPLARKEAA